MLLFFIADDATANYTKLDNYIAEHLSESSELKCSEPKLLPSSILHACSFTSQKWPAGTDTIEGQAWTHNITIATPRKLQDIPDTALYFSDGGDNERPGDYLKQFIMLARLKNGSVAKERTFSPGAIMDLLVQHTNAVIVYQQQVPNQPYTFLDAPETVLTEDNLLAESLVRAVNAPDGIDPAATLLFPMAQANVAGLYRASEYINTVLENNPIKHFIVGGASKRAWAIWLATAFDQGTDPQAKQLVSGIVPVAMIQHFPETLKAIRKSYCHFPKPLSPYVNRHIFQDLLSSYDDRYDRLFADIDPYTYLKKHQRFDKIHTLVIQPSSDGYFIPDATHYYYPDLKGDKHIMVIPNTGHGSAMPAMSYLYGALSNITALIHGQPLPNYAEDYDHFSHTLTVHTENKPEHVYVWSANNTGARDFRLDSAEFTRQEILPMLALNDSITYQWQPEPLKGWTAFFMEMHYSVPGAKPFVLSTQVYITPDRYSGCR
ncbi:PhoPQ-activated pathogenicity-related family protein [Kistimonas scapharcae]|uniref:PhoPQ-activated pathogenicity-related family protein n=2 Tax=Kistimonas scapharcae TaxID=1036133 RepID=A0ABP8V582_9GAMM